MQLERISVVLRPRTPREAVDLGVALLRVHARAVWTAWFVFTLPVAVIAIALGVLIGAPGLGLLILWWLLPLFDRLPLFVLSRAVFDRAPAWRDTLGGQRAMPWRGTWASLTWRRIDAHRALRLPLELLEGLSPAQRAPRWRVLSRHIGGSSWMLTVGLFGLEWLLFFSVFMLAAMFIPSEFIDDLFRQLFGGSHGLPHGAWLAASIVGYLVMSVMEPWYIASGFGMYLARRTQLEAWDIDLTFRRMRQRLVSAARVLVLLACLGLAVPSAHAGALTPNKLLDRAASRPDSSVQIEDVFGPLDPARDREFSQAAHEAAQDPRFGHPSKEMAWVRREQPKAEEKQKNAPRVRHAPDSGGVNIIAGGVNIVLWIMLGLVIVALVIFALRHFKGVRLRRGPDRLVAPLETVVSDAVMPERLPDDVASVTRRLWQGGRHRDALALLYRACVAQLAAATQVAMPDDATEAESLRRARSLQDKERSRQAVAIVRTWQYAAYADRFPTDGEVDALLTGWPAQAGPLP
ncbi:DUF4129 domain-containing protein [Dyella sp.]|uniref:DUF4129 domain-containing protein n=1 Tax=Dyella sp. TaxID=1869338 RepID=UPI002ED01BAA